MEQISVFFCQGAEEIFLCAVGDCVGPSAVSPVFSHGFFVAGTVWECGIYFKQFYISEESQQPGRWY
jgi:hypothetical protein